MTFFSTLADRIEGYTLQLTVTRNENGTLTIMIYPKVSEKEDVQSAIVPLSLTGTPMELDQEFFARLGTPLDKVKEFGNQVKMFEKALEKAAEKAKPKDKTVTVGKSKEPEKKDEPKMTFDKAPETKAQDTVPEKAEEVVNKGTGEVKQTAAAATPSAVTPSATTAAVSPEPDPPEAETPQDEQPQTENVEVETPGDQGSMNDEEDW